MPYLPKGADMLLVLSGGLYVVFGGFLLGRQVGRARGPRRGCRSYRDEVEVETEWNRTIVSRVVYFWGWYSPLHGGLAARGAPRVESRRQQRAGGGPPGEYLRVPGGARGRGRLALDGGAGACREDRFGVTRWGAGRGGRRGRDRARGSGSVRGKRSGGGGSAGRQRQRLRQSLGHRDGSRAGVGGPCQGQGKERRYG